MKQKNQKKHVFRNIMLVIGGFVLLAVITLLVINQVSYLRERKEHEKAGFYHGVKIKGGRKMNVVELGNPDGAHTLIGISGMGINDYCVYMERVNEVIGENNTLVYVDRAGNGYSDDTLKAQTISQVVDDYRSALQKAGYEAPYVLMPHSLGGLYATYWESHYPDEIEGVMYIDCTLFTGDIDTRGEEGGYLLDGYSTAEIVAAMASSRLGLQRFLPSQGYPIGSSTLTEEELRLTKMADNRGYTFAFLSEARHEYETMHEARDTCVKNDIPKFYLTTMYASVEDIRDYFTYMNREMEVNGEEPMMKPDQAESFWSTTEEQLEELTNDYLLPYVEMVGNCELIFLGGDHFIFLQKPDELSQIILDFLEELP